MFDLFTLPRRVASLERRIVTMSAALDLIRAELLALQETAVAEKAEVDLKFAALELKLEEALAQPDEPVDVSDILETIQAIRGQVAGITEPALLEVPPADDVPADVTTEIID
jgi:hypothetical protein